MTQARGLNNFIADIRNAGTKEAEHKRVEKELANIRQKFSAAEKLNSYNKKKYVWKLVYIFVLGYEVEFGHMEAISLMTSNKFSEKTVGYTAISLMLLPDLEMLTLVINSIKNDLSQPAADDAVQALALACIANMGGTGLAEALTRDVVRLLTMPNSDPCVRKKAALCLLRLFRTNPECITHGEWADKLSALLTQPHLGVLTSAMSLLLGLASRSPGDYEGLVPYVIQNLSRLVTNRSQCRTDYLYYNTPSPWLQVKLLKFLQYYPAPTDQTQVTRLNEVLNKIITKTDASESVNKSNADHSVLFESVNLIIHQGQESDSKLRHQALTLLGRFISVREPNIRYIGLQTMARLAQLEGNEDIKKHESTVLISLKDADISVRRRALDLLFVMCDENNTSTIVEELIIYLGTADAAIKEEMVLKIAIVAEKYASDLTWYVEKILQIMSLAGDFVSDDIWYRLVQIVTNNKDLQGYAAEKLFVVLQSPYCHESTVRVGAYVLGEFGFLIAENAGRSGEDQFALLQSHFVTSSPSTQYQMLTTYMKMANLYEECRDLAAPVFAKYRAAGELEMQQRANEYTMLPGLGEEMMEDVLREMPAFQSGRKSALERRLQQRDLDTNDGNAWVMKKGEDAEAEGGEGTEEAAPDAPPPNLLDLDGGAEQPPQPPPAAPGQADFGSSGDGGTGEAVGIADALLPHMKRWFNALVVGPQGVLFENDTMQVGVKHAYQQSQARVAVFFKNKTDAPMANLVVTMPEVPYLRVRAEPVPTDLAPQASAQYQIMAECMQPYDVAPELTVSFDSAGRSHLYPLRLPTVATCFVEPVSLGRDDFLQRWGALEGHNREQQVVFNAANPIDSASMADISGRLFTQGLKLGIATGLAQNEFVVAAAGTFRTGSVSPTGAKISVGCLVKLEANPQAGAFRLTVRAVHGQVSVALKNVIKSQLS